LVTAIPAVFDAAARLCCCSSKTLLLQQRDFTVAAAATIGVAAETYIAEETFSINTKIIALAAAVFAVAILCDTVKKILIA
jgi:hypothetical protein